MSDEELIRREIGRFIEAFDNSDLDGIMSCYTQDLIKLRQGAPAENREQLRDRLAQTFSQWTGRLDVTIDEIVVSNDMAFVRSHLEIVLRPRGEGEVQSARMRFVELWRKEHGQWRVARAMDNREA